MNCQKLKGFAPLLIPFLLLLAPGMAAAESGGTGITGKASTLGIGIELSHSFNQYFAGRIGYNRFDFDYDDTVNGIDYDFDLELDSVSAMLDWHPVGGRFRVSAGALSNNNAVKARADTSMPINIGGTIYLPSDVGNLTAVTDFDSIAPYIGIGWGNTSRKGPRFSVDLGVAFQGSPNVEFMADGLLASDPGFQQDLDQEAQELEDELERFEYYPVISLGFSFNF